METNVDAVGERDESHLEAVWRLSGADRQRVNDSADELYDARKCVALDAARRVQRKYYVHFADSSAHFTYDKVYDLMLINNTGYWRHLSVV